MSSTATDLTGADPLLDEVVRRLVAAYAPERLYLFGSRAHDLSADPPLLEDALFHAQQAAEKAMKALLSWHDRPFPRTHDLSRLGADCAALDSTLTELMRQAAPLSEYAWRHRYPGPDEPVDAAEANRSLDLAADVLAAIRERLPADVLR